VREYREAMRGFAQLSHLDVWHERINASELVDRFGGRLGKHGRILFTQPFAEARRKTSMRAVKKLTEHIDGEPRFRSIPPLVVRFSELHDPADPRDEAEYVRDLLEAYVKSLDEDRRYLFSTYRFVDMARKVVGVGSVGTRAWVLLFGERVVRGQRMDQAAFDVFLGWQRSQGLDGKEHDFYIRQLWDWKASIDLASMTYSGLLAYTRACGWSLVRAHARSGDRLAIAAYLGNGGRFDDAIARFSNAYADQNELDHRRLTEAVEAGEVAAVRRV
jgi:hypothetical protein